ncbi:MAG: helix-hairpin-helix domain-containing protein [Nitrospira sp.]|nr:helix-hairpin-helix domain-containing protein [Nitrospira sp.]
MIRSLAIKLGLLTATMGMVWWIVWQAPDGVDPETLSPDEPAPLAVEASVKEPPIPKETETQAGAAGEPVKNTVRIARSSHNRRGSQIRSGPLRPVDLNRADINELESLPGIGAVLARRVMEYRESIGRFRTIEDLLAVKGIGPKTLERIRPFVMVVEREKTAKVEERPS